MLALCAVSMLGVQARADDKWSGGSFSVLNGGKLRSGAMLFFGTNPGAPVGEGIAAYSATNNTINIGDTVTYAAVSVLPGVVGYVPMAVTESTSAGAYVIGVAVSKTTAVGQKTLIQTYGVVDVKSMVGFTAGDFAVQSTTAGGVTASSAAANGFLTGISQTAIVGQVVETKVASGFIRMFLRK